MLANLPETERTRGFFAVWSRKEAFVKALGTGIAHRLGSFSVSVEPSNQPDILETYWDPSARDEWGIRDIPLPTGYAGAVVARGRDWDILLREWQHGE
jgi:4'-phosphopantetheinyl transferase